MTKRTLEGFGGLLVFIGGCGVLRELTDGWFSFMGFTRFLTEQVDFLADRALFTYIVMTVAGFGTVMIANRGR
ncbi:hypothetical protein [Streptomyces sp. CAU 1734]|uniref:hypothetical protein n=1 Tax=Streptomyces sp. CAU 1734 TaxID=3140360 RepID=UPI003260E0E4